MPKDISVSQVLTDISTELEQFHLAVGEVESTVMTLLEENNIVLEENVVEKLQHIDLLAQSTSALASYVKHLSTLKLPAINMDTTAAISSIPLNDMRCRLTPNSEHNSKTSTAKSGSSEMFF